MEQEFTEKIGEVRIANEVLSAIAGLAATEVEGVSALDGGLTHDMITHSGIKSLEKGVRLTIEDNCVSVKLMLILSGAVPIPKVFSGVQEKVSAAIGEMTGMDVTDVDVTITGVNV